MTGTPATRTHSEPTDAGPDYLGRPLQAFLDQVASDQPAPGGGAVAAVSTALAAGLVGMAARFSAEQVAGSAEVAARADRLRSEAAELAAQDATAYAAVLAAYRLPRETDPHGRRERIRSALHGAAEVPLRIATLAAEVGQAAADLAEQGNPNLRGDAVTAALLSRAAAQSAAALVQINVAAGRLGDDLNQAADQCVHTAALAARRATAAAVQGRWSA